MGNLYLSVDLGGTSLRIGVLEATGKVLELLTVDSDEVRQPQNLTQQLKKTLLSLWEKYSSQGKHVEGAALGIPGLVNHDEGIIYQSPHFPQWKNFSLIADLKGDLPFPIFIENDANKAALAEAWHGAGKQFQDFIMLTLGTGIGAGIIMDRKIFRGPTGLAGEVGHMVIERHGQPGALGIQGTLETFASLSGLRLQLESFFNRCQDDRGKDPISRLNLKSPKLPEELSRLAEEGNDIAQALWQDFGQALACGMASLTHALGIFKFVIGGGLAGAWDHFFPALQEELPKRLYQSTYPMVEIIPAKLGSEAGLVGGIPMIQQGLQEK